MCLQVWKLDKGMASAYVIMSLAGLLFSLSAIGFAYQVAEAKIFSQGFVDTAALGAADSLRGLVAGFPCENAEQILQSGGLRLKTCRIVGLGVSIEAEYSLWFATLGARASASAPDMQ
ncbi:MAG: flp pilus-assembly TadE/G-like family protein [Aquiluna sp.]|nr:flp pilus-assembly TadE/G-like family protein [Aquiluna sp.]MCF8545963.1 flp pilus-assembly TadE/G-like family protein [Aquiluna sp.]